MKDKGPKKFGTVINLNDLEKDEKLDTSSLTASASTTTSTTSGEFTDHHFPFMPLCSRRVDMMPSCSSFLIAFLFAYYHINIFLFLCSSFILLV